MKLFLAALILFAASVGYAVETKSKNFYVSLSGDSALKEKIMTALKSKDCFYLSDLDPANASGGECHSFREYSASSEIKGKTYLYKVNAKLPIASTPGHISMQGFQKKGKKLTRTFNPGKIQIPSALQIQSAEADYSEEQFIKDAAKKIVGLSFK